MNESIRPPCAAPKLRKSPRAEPLDLRLDATSAIDELNSHIGLLMAFGDLHPDWVLGNLLGSIRQDLCDLHDELSGDGAAVLQHERIVALDDWLMAARATPMPRLRQLIRPGCPLAVAQAHVCRAVCRRAQRLASAANLASGSGSLSQYLGQVCEVLIVLSGVLSPGVHPVQEEARAAE